MAPFFNQSSPRFQKRLSTSTNPGGIVELGFANARDNRKWQGWPKDRPKYLRFALTKANRETLWAINTLSKTVGVNAKAFSWAGTKDKRGVTTQLITAHMVPADKVARFNFSRAAGTNVRVGNFDYVANALELGNLNVSSSV